MPNRPVFWCQLGFPNWFITLLHVEVSLLVRSSHCIELRVQVFFFTFPLDLSTNGGYKKTCIYVICQGKNAICACRGKRSQAVLCNRSHRYAFCSSAYSLLWLLSYVWWTNCTNIVLLFVRGEPNICPLLFHELLCRELNQCSGFTNDNALFSSPLM